VSEAWERAAEAIGARFPDVEFRRGHEVLLDVPEVDLSDPRLRLAGTSFVLVEWPRLRVPPRTGPVLERIRAMGYRPIVAHPERYAGIVDSMHVVEEWRSVGAYLQVNYGSIVGLYGDSARGAAERLLRRGWVDYLATDFHGHARLEIHMAEATAALEELGAHETLACLCRTNPARLLSDEEPLPVPIVPAERGFWATLRGLVQGARA
jgi:protein-tyrosine phosphatase